MKKYIPEEGDNNQIVPSIEVTRIDNIPGQQRYFLEKDDFHQIDKNSLVPGQEVNFSIFNHKGINFQAVIDAAEKSPEKISPKIFDIEGDIVIKAADIPLYKQYLGSLEETDLTDKYKEKFKTVLIKEKSKIVMRDVLADPTNSDNIKHSSIAVKEIATTICSNKDALYDLLSIINSDYYLYTHSVNVAVLSIGLGMSIGLTADEIFSLGVGAILHDIGKSSIPPEILNKPTRLTPGEFKIMKRHVIEGEKILRRHECFPEESFPVVTQHHEKLSGKGYPFGLDAVKINLFGKIAAITDAYDALTAQSPYKYALNPFSALNIMVTETENYDRELLTVFIKILGRVKMTGEI